MKPEVIVAGAGPVGLTAALALAQRGVEVLMLEAGEGLATESRASTFHAPTLEMLAELGAIEAVLEQGIVCERFQYRDRDAGLLCELDFSLLADATPYPMRLQLEQSKLTPILLDLLAAQPTAAVRFAAPVVAFSEADRGVDVVIEGGETIRASWLIGADGAHSAVRKASGISFEGLTYPDRFLIVSTDADLLAEIPGSCNVNYVFDPVEWLFILRTPEHWRVLFPITDPEETDEQATSDERVQDRMRGLKDLGRPWPVLHTTIYNVHQRIADTFRSRRVCLVGDAAHVNNPLGGMGMNSGIHDAFLLAEVLAGGGDDSALDAWAVDRKQVASGFVQQITHGNWAQLREADATARAARYAELARWQSDRGAMREYLLKASMIASLRPELLAEAGA